MTNVHIPVLLQSVLHYLQVIPGKHYIDATLGGSGHSAAIAHLGGLVLGLDQDLEAISACPRLQGLTPVHANFTHLSEVVARYSWFPATGILYDLGLSTTQISQPIRGFSFQAQGPLDMRMDTTLPVTAAKLVNTLPKQQLINLFKDFGQLPTAKTLAQKITTSRPLTTTSDLARISGKWTRQVFQALRIAVNDELGALASSLPQALTQLGTGGRLLVISFHSLEDRLVKHLFLNWSNQGLGQIVTSKPVVPDPEELASNPRSHSAKLRVFQKL